MRSSFALVAVVIALGTFWGVVCAAQQLRDSPAARDALVAQRNRLAAQADQLVDGGKRREALAAAEQMLAVQRQLNDATFPEWLHWLDWVAGQHEATANFEAALRWRQEAVEVAGRPHGERHWRATDARLALRHTNRLRQLTPQQRQALAGAETRQQQVGQLYAQGQYGQALALALQVRDVYQQLLGQEHPQTATSLNNLALLYES